MSIHARGVSTSGMGNPTMVSRAREPSREKRDVFFEGVGPDDDDDDDDDDEDDDEDDTVMASTLISTPRIPLVSRGRDFGLFFQASNPQKIRITTPGNERLDTQNDGFGKGGSFWKRWVLLQEMKIWRDFMVLGLLGLVIISTH